MSAGFRDQVELSEQEKTILAHAEFRSSDRSRDRKAVRIHGADGPLRDEQADAVRDNH